MKRKPRQTDLIYAFQITNEIHLIANEMNLNSVNDMIDLIILMNSLKLENVKIK